MKKFHLLLIALAIVSLGGLGWLGWRGYDAGRVPLVPRVQHVDKASTTASKEDPPTNIANDPLKIFQKAFWASPTPEDEILHAERREWMDSDNVQKWQWFLVVKPSPALLKRLRDDNTFGLIQVSEADLPSDAPEWFACNKDEGSVLKAPQGNLQLIFSKDKHTLYATDCGLGLRPGAPQPVKPPAPPASHPKVPGLLPSIHPPIPEPPDTPDTPEPPDTPDTPEPPETPAPAAVPEAPAAPETPAAPEAPAAPETPAAPEMPAAPADGNASVPPVREDGASRLSAHESTGWKPVGQDRQDACPPTLPNFPQ